MATHSADVVVLSASGGSPLTTLPEEGGMGMPDSIGPPPTVAVAVAPPQVEGSGGLVGTTLGAPPRPRIVIPTTPARKRRYSRHVSASMRRVARAFLPEGAVGGESYRFVRDRNWVPSSTPVNKRDLSLWSSARVCAYHDFVLPLRTQLFLVAVFPCISLAIGISPFLVPYNDLEDGPGANTSFFLSLFIGAFLVYFAPISMVSNLTKIPVDNVQRVCAAAVCALIFAGSAALGGYTWTFPVPFVVITGAFPGFLMCVVLVYFMVPKRLRTFGHTRKAILKGMAISVLALAMMLVWAGVRVAFVRLRDGHWQALVCISIPLLKMVARDVFVRIAKTVDADLAPTFTFIVEYFNGIFSTTMLASATFTSGMILVSVDAALNIYKTYALCAGKQGLCERVTEWARECTPGCSLWCRCFSCFAPCPTSSVKPVSRSSFHVKLPEWQPSEASTGITSVSGSQAVPLTPSVPATPGAVSFDFARSRASSTSYDVGEGNKSSSDVRQGTRSPPSAKSRARRARGSWDESTATVDSSNDMDQVGVGAPPTTSIPDAPATSVPDAPATSIPDAPATSIPDAPTTSIPDALTPVERIGSGADHDAAGEGSPQAPSGMGSPYDMEAEPAQGLDFEDDAKATSPPVRITKTRRLSNADTTRLRDVLRKAELLILAEYTEVFVPLQYLVFMMFAYYGYNRHAFFFSDIIRTEAELATTSGWVVVLVTLDLIATAVTSSVVQRYHDISLLRVLAFAVKEHWWLLLNFVVLMYVFVISLYLRHTGCDFTFKFEWMHE